MKDIDLEQLKKICRTSQFGPQMGYAETVSSESLLLKPYNLKECKGIIDYCRDSNIKICVKGGGYSYGDMILLEGEVILDCSELKKIISFDKEEGLISLEPGVSFADVFRLTLLENWTLTSCPGGMDVTIGGAISNNVHGKDAWDNGNFGDQVVSLEMILSDGSTLFLEKNDKRFSAVIGGMGLLGLVTRIDIKLKKIPSAFVQVKTEVVRNIEESLKVLEARKLDSDFSVAWVDAFSKGDILGRGYVTSACWVEEELKVSKKQLEDSLTKPKFIFGFLPSKPFWFIGRLFFKPYVLKLLNKIHYFLAKNFFSKNNNSLSPILFTDFNFMHNKIPDIREVYRPYGFYEFEPLIPFSGEGKNIRHLLELCQEYGAESLLCAVKSHREDDYLISFEGQGFSIGIDIQVKGRSKKSIRDFVKALSDYVTSIEGKIYLAKDENISKNSFEQMYPRYIEFIALKEELDPEGVFCSDMYKRLMS